MNFFDYIKNYRRILLLLIIVLTVTITFETSQQLFYLRRFNLNNEVTFYYLLKNQAYRWLIWFILSGVIFWFINSISDSKNSSNQLILKYALLIIGLVSINIVIISVIQLILNNDPFTIRSFIFEYLQFFIFQKGPMYTLGYTAITAFIHLYIVNKKLSVEISNLAELKVTNTELYHQLKNRVDEKSTVLNIKIGNKRKIIPVDDITWIEADDYCVKVHTTAQEIHTMRNSLKALENKLGTHFIRVHRKALVNMNFMNELYTSSNATYLTLKNNIRVPVSKKSLRSLRNYIN